MVSYLAKISDSGTSTPNWDVEIRRPDYRHLERGMSRFMVQGAKTSKTDTTK